MDPSPHMKYDGDDAELFPPVFGFNASLPRDTLFHTNSLIPTVDQWNHNVSSTSAPLYSGPFTSTTDSLLSMQFVDSTSAFTSTDSLSTPTSVERLHEMDSTSASDSEGYNYANANVNASEATDTPQNGVRKSIRIPSSKTGRVSTSQYLEVAPTVVSRAKGVRKHRAPEDDDESVSSTYTRRPSTTLSLTNPKVPNEHIAQSSAVRAAIQKAAELTPIHNAPDDEDEDYLQRKERNKLSASQYRKRRKVFVELLEEKVAEMEQLLNDQSQVLEQLRMENEQLKLQARGLTANGSIPPVFHRNNSPFPSSSDTDDAPSVHSSPTMKPVLPSLAVADNTLFPLPLPGQTNATPAWLPQGVLFCLFACVLMVALPSAADMAVTEGLMGVSSTPVTRVGRKLLSIDSNGSAGYDLFSKVFNLGFLLLVTMLVAVVPIALDGVKTVMHRVSKVMSNNGLANQASIRNH